MKQIHFDIAFSLQKKYEEIFFKILNQIKYNKESNNLCLSGGCANNSLANGKIFKKRLQKQLEKYVAFHVKHEKPLKK